MANGPGPNTPSDLSQQQIIQRAFEESGDVLRVKTLSSLVPETYDYISLSYTGSNLTGVVYKTGGSSGTTVATLVLAYDGSNNLISVTKT